MISSDIITLVPLRRRRLALPSPGATDLTLRPKEPPDMTALTPPLPPDVIADGDARVAANLVTPAADDVAGSRQWR